MSAPRAALAPVAAGILTLAGLAAWSATGHAGRPARLRVDDAWVMAPTAPRTAAYFTVTNSGDDADALLEVRTPVAATTMLGHQVDHAGAGRMVMGGQLPVPAHGVMRMTPFTDDVMFRPREPLPVGRRIPFTLVFRDRGAVRVTAVVVPPGSRD
jgi:copper(I)-binding protein